MAKEQIQCPQCKSFKTQTAKQQAVILGIALIITGSLFSLLIIGAIIGVPMMILGLALLLALPFVKDKGKMYCRNCHYKWNRFEQANQEAAH